MEQTNQTQEEKQTEDNMMTSIGLKGATKKRLQKFWRQQDTEGEIKSFDGLITEMITYIEEAEKQEE